MPWFVTYERNGETCHEIDHVGPRRTNEARLRSNEHRIRITDAEACMPIFELAEEYANPSGGLGGA